MVDATTIPLEQYLRTLYRPDREFLEGVLVERAVGELDHSNVQTNLMVHCSAVCKGFRALPSVRACVRPGRYRIADVSIVRLPLPDERFFTSPPFVVAEVLSPDDQLDVLQSRIDDFLEFGVAAVWVLDPQQKRAFVHRLGSSHEVMDGVLREADLVVPLDEVFND